jgi:GABA permease
MQRQQFDEVIISTLPKRVSRWLHQDLPSKVRRHVSIPVTVVTAAEVSD